MQMARSIVPCESYVVQVIYGSIIDNIYIYKYIYIIYGSINVMLAYNAIWLRVV